MNTRKKKLHVIGMCGKGTSAVAYLMQQKGWEISGSDNGAFEPIASYLREHNLPCTVPCAAENIPNDVDMILMGSSAILEPDTNPEITRGLSMNVPIKTFAEILGELTVDTHNIVVAGSYGKSTCTSLLSYYLEYNKKSPSYFIGAVPIGMDSASRLGDSEYFILEGDEYPHDTKSLVSKFMFYNPRTVLLTSGEHDHINKFPTLSEYLKTYQGLMEIVPPDGLVVAAINHSNVSDIIAHAACPVVTYGITNADYTARNIQYADTSSFDVYKGEECIAHFVTTLLGEFNIENLLGTIVLCLEEQLLTIPELQSATLTFKGVAGRMDKKSDMTTIPVYEAYGSSYTKAKAALEAMQLHYPNKKIITMFEPHTFGWRNRGNLNWYHDVFDGSDIVLVYQPPTHGAASHDQITQSDIMQVLKERNQQALAINNQDQALSYLQKNLGQDNVILLLTSGNLDGMIESVPTLCEELFPKK